MNLFAGLLALFGYHAAPAPQPAPMPPVIYEVRSFVVTDEKSVFATIQSTYTVPARVRTGGTIVSLAVRQGDYVTRGQIIANIGDPKLTEQLLCSPGRRRTGRRWRKLRRTMTARNTWLAHRPQHVRPVPHPTPQLATSRCARPNGARDGVTSSACLALSKAPL